MQTMEFSRTDEGMDDLNRQIGELREEMRAGFKDVRSEIKDVRFEIKDMRSDIKDVRSDLSAEITDVRSELLVEIKGVRSELRADLGGMRATMENRFDAVHRWMLGTMTTMLIVLASILVASMQL